jgi:D-serine deaminase-like pyridoxal phosphate-dependent protein
LEPALATAVPRGDDLCMFALGRCILKNSLDALHKQIQNGGLEASALSGLLTPTLAIFPQEVAHNIDIVLALLGGNVQRWQPHVKAAKLLDTLRIFCNKGIKQFKCATTLEALTACRAGAEEVLMAYPCVGPRAERIREIADCFPSCRLSVTVERATDIDRWRDTRVGVYIDVDPGMNRTGIALEQTCEVIRLAKRASGVGVAFQGLHCYEGHLQKIELETRSHTAHLIYTKLVCLIEALRREGIHVDTLLTTGTPTFECALSFPAFSSGLVPHRVSLGTIMYGDRSTFATLPSDWGLKLGALVITSVVSHPTSTIITCDAGHKVLSADRGFPNCIVVGHEDFQPLEPNEEHMRIKLPHISAIPEIGEKLYVVPANICATINNFDQAVQIVDGKVIGTATISARGRESSLIVDRT